MSEQNVEHGEGQELVNQLVACLSGEGEDLIRKQEIVYRLVSDRDLVTKLRADKAANEVQDLKMGNEKSDLRPWVHGWLLQEFVHEERGPHTPESELILSLMHDPERFDLMYALGLLKNPDDADISVDEHKNEILLEGVTEVKAGGLSYKSLDQLMKFEPHMRICFIMLDDLSKNGQLEEHGLGLLTGRIFKMVDPDNFRIEVVIPADGNVNDPKSLIVKRSFHSQAKREIYEDFLDQQIQEGKVVFTTSLFSHKELERMADVVLPLMAGIIAV